MSSAQKPPDPNIGRSILNGQFIIEQKIGSGGMGAVYRASQPAMNRQVAVKILHPKLTTRKDLASRFRREARAMSHLSHPNTVKVFLYDELDDGSLCIVMEYLEGKNLNQWVRREGPMPVERAIPILMQVCGALHEAHGLGIIHRDLKPENIFVSKAASGGDVAKVLDFGLAKVTERELRPGSIMLTQEGMVFGTPEFMSPEQAQGKKLDARSDLYSLAAILYEVLTGKLPFDAKTPMEFIQLHVTRPPIPLHERVPTKPFSRGLSRVVMRALSKKPEERYATAHDFAEALKPYAQGDLPDELHKSIEPTQPERLGAGLDSQKTLKMSQPLAPSAPVSSGRDGPRSMPAPVSSPGPLGAQAAAPASVQQVPVTAGRATRGNGASKGGVKFVTLVVVAIACLLLGVGITTAVILLTQS